MIEYNGHVGGVWGWRGVLGYIAPSVFAMLGEDFYQTAPEGVGLMVVTLGMNVPDSATEVDGALAGVEQAARQLAAGKPDFIFLGGLPLSIAKGFGYDQEIARRIEAAAGGIQAIAEITAAMEAFRALSIRKLVIANPSPPNLKIRYKEFLEANGFQVVNMGGPEIPMNNDKRKLPGHISYLTAKKIYYEAPEADGIYMPCGSFRIAPAVVEAIEKDLGKPVVTSNQCFIWAGLKALKIKEPARGYGRLFQTL